MGNAFDPRSDRHVTAIFQPRTSAGSAVKLAVYEIIQRFEEEKGRMPYAVEVAQKYATAKQQPLGQTRALIERVVYDMWRDDILWASPTCEQFAHRKCHPSFLKSSELLRTDRRFQGVTWSEAAPKSFFSESREAINLKDLRTLLQGRDFEAYQVYKDRILQDGLPRLLDGADLEHQKVALLADQGTGATLLRRYLELVTGIATGSDAAAGSAQPLSVMGMIGEHIVDERVWISRTTYPIRAGQHEQFHDFDSNKLLVLVRNPVDVILSKLHAQVSGTRSKKADVDFAEHTQFISDHVDAAVKEAYAVYTEAFTQFKERNVPVYFVRFEQLVEEPQKTLEDIFKFLLDTRDVEGTVVQKRIKEVAEMNPEAKQVYPVESSPPPSMDHFTARQQNTIFSKLYDSMEFFGYLRQDNLGDG